MIALVGGCLGVCMSKELSELGVNHHGSGTSLLEKLRSVTSVIIRQTIWQYCFSK